MTAHVNVIFILVVLVVATIVASASYYVSSMTTGQNDRTHTSSCGLTTNGAQTNQTDLVSLTGNAVPIMANSTLLGPADPCMRITMGFWLKDLSNYTAKKVVVAWEESLGITPGSFGCSFGSCTNDSVDTINTPMAIGQAEAALHVQIDFYRYDYRSLNLTYFANSANPELPENVANVVLGVIGLDNASIIITG